MPEWKEAIEMGSEIWGGTKFSCHIQGYGIQMYHFYNVYGLYYEYFIYTFWSKTVAMNNLGVYGGISVLAMIFQLSTPLS